MEQRRTAWVTIGSKRTIDVWPAEDTVYYSEETGEWHSLNGPMEPPEGTWKVVDPPDFDLPARNTVPFKALVTVEPILMPMANCALEKEVRYAIEELKKCQEELSPPPSDRGLDLGLDLDATLRQACMHRDRAMARLKKMYFGSEIQGEDYGPEEDPDVDTGG